MFRVRRRLNDIRQAVSNTVDRAIQAVERVVDRAVSAVRSVIPFDAPADDPQSDQTLLIIEEAIGELETIQAQEVEILEASRRDFETYVDDLDNELSAEEEFYQAISLMGGGDDEAAFLWERQILPIRSNDKTRRRPFASIEDMINYVNDGSFPLGYVDGFYYDGAFFYLKVDGG